MDLEVGQRGWLLVDVGDVSFGPHRIALSNILRIEEGNNLVIETENTIYHLRGTTPTESIGTMFTPFIPWTTRKFIGTRMRRMVRNCLFLSHER